MKKIYQNMLARKFAYSNRKKKCQTKYYFILDIVVFMTQLLLLCVIKHENGFVMDVVILREGSSNKFLLHNSDIILCY